MSSGPVQDIINKLSLIGKQKDLQKVLTELEEVEKSVKYVRKIVLRKLRPTKSKSVKERAEIIWTTNNSPPMNSSTN